MRFAKAAEQNFKTEIFRVTKVIEKRPPVVYELSDLNGTQPDGQLFQGRTDPVSITDRTSYKLDKILDKRVRRGIREYLIRWRGYNKEFHSWVSATSVKNV